MSDRWGAAAHTSERPSRGRDYGKERIVTTTTSNLKTKLIASAVAAAAAAPALLFLGAATAQAKGPDLSVAWDPWLPGVGLTAHITNNTFADLPQCSYTATPDPNQPLQGLPTYVSPPFALPPKGSYNLPITTYDLPIPGLATGTKWFVTVDCGFPYVNHFQRTF